jgi:hypothetical protein
VNGLFPAGEIAHPDWEQRHRVPSQRHSVDPLACLASRELHAPQDWAPTCGAWASDHCPDCLLCPGVHADGCRMGSDIRCPRCGEKPPYHRPDCGIPATNHTKEG